MVGPPGGKGNKSLSLDNIATFWRRRHFGTRLGDNSTRSGAFKTRSIYETKVKYTKWQTLQPRHLTLLISSYLESPLTLPQILGCCAIHSGSVCVARRQRIKSIKKHQYRGIRYVNNIGYVYFIYFTIPNTHGHF